MKIAIIADIHGNSYALKEVLNAAHSYRVEKLLVLGDLVGYYYHPDEVVNMIYQWDHELIRGNHEDLLASMMRSQITESELRLRYGSGHRMAAEKLSKVQADNITAAPAARRVTIDGVRMSMYHGSPWNHDEYLYPDAPVDILERCDEAETDFVLVGHSHYAFLHRNRSSTLINVGSVGQSRHTGGIANWTLIDTANKSIQMKATPYDTRELMAEVAEMDPNVHYLKDILKRNRN